MDKLVLVGETKRGVKFISKLEGFPRKAEFSNDLYFIKYSVSLIKYILKVDWVKWYKRNSDFRIEVWQDDLREYFKTVIIGFK